MIFYCERDVHIFHDLLIGMYFRALFFLSDDAGAFHIANSPVLHKHTIHVELDCLNVHEKKQMGLFRVLHVWTCHLLRHFFYSVQISSMQDRYQYICSIFKGILHLYIGL